MVGACFVYYETALSLLWLVLGVAGSARGQGLQFRSRADRKEGAGQGQVHTCRGRAGPLLPKREPMPSLPASVPAVPAIARLRPACAGLCLRLRFFLCGMGLGCLAWAEPTGVGRCCPLPVLKATWGRVKCTVPKASESRERREGTHLRLCKERQEGAIISVPGTMTMETAFSHTSRPANSVFSTG
ncbi:hypothetical protein CCUS01_16521 [Colletotrichum cuscutae]|uniref:Uncharacterized protein n=1 Tax=Colletotrichum cuscutae TaxID=1209917 RepID=A0AAI9VCQ8_9PEZI|nr:hypothetical protein CCUS01_16521 [Colletotrichum cuscutae]